MVRGFISVVVICGIDRFIFLVSIDRGNIFV